MLGDSAIDIASSSLFLQVSCVDVFQGCPLLLERAVGERASSQEPSIRCYVGRGQLLEYIKDRAPAYVQARWPGCGNDRSIVACEVGFSNGQLMARWRDSVGYRGSFQKPVR